MRSLVSLGILVLGACVARPLELAEVQAESSARASLPSAEGRSDACVPLDGDSTSCCPSRLGLDPQLVRERCGWSEYLGERREISCVHAFRDRRGERVELRVTGILGLGFARALELLEASFVEIDGVEREVWKAEPEGGEISRVAYEGDSWALVGGWPDPRRVSWRTRDCADEAMLVVLGQMSAAPIDPAGATAVPEFDLDPDEPIDRAGLLADRSASTYDVTDSRLPDDAPAFAEAVIDRAAANDLAGFSSLLAPEARWGLPDRRQLGGRPIGSSTSDAGPALVALRQAAVRMTTGAAPDCPAPDRRMRAALARGEYPQWCFWLSDDGLDVIALSLRSIEGQVRLEYLGVFPRRPTEPLGVIGEPPPPPLSPRPSIHCGDPHHHDLVRCPELAEPEPETQLNQRPASTIR